MQAHFDNSAMLAFQEYPISKITFSFNFKVASKN